MSSPLIFGETNPPILSTHTDETDPRTTPVSPVPKKLTEDVDFSPQIRSIISRTYSESPNTYSEELSLLNRSRQDALRGAAGSDVTARDLLYKYFGQLELLELRFPDLKVPFPWFVLLSPTLSCSFVFLVSRADSPPARVDRSPGVTPSPKPRSPNYP